MQLEKTSYTLASPLVVGRISAGNNLYIKSDQLVNDKSIIESRNDSYLHSKNITAISQKLGEKSVWVAMHNALDQSANYILLQGSLHQIFGYIPAHHAYQKSDYEDARIRYFVDYGQYLSFIPADIAEKAPYESFIYDSATHLIPVNQPEIGLWRDHDFLAARFSATNNLVITADNIQFNKIYPQPLNSVAELHEKFDDKQLLVGKNITLNSKQLTGSLSAQAQNNLSISSENILLNNSELSANNELNLIAKNDIALTDTGLAGHNVLLLSKNGAISYQAAEYHRYDDDDFWQYDLFPDEDLFPYFDIAPKYKLLAAKNRLDMIAGQDIQIDNKVALNVPIINITTNGSIYFNRPEKALFNKPLHYDRLELNLKSIYDFHDKEYHQRDLETSEQYQPKWQKARHILLNAGKDIVFNGVDLQAEQGIEVFAGNDIQLAPAPFKLQDNFYLLLKRRFTNLDTLAASFYSPQLKSPFDLSSNIKSPTTQAFKSYLTSEGTLLLNAGRDLNLQAAELSSKQATHLFAGRNIDLSVKILTTDLIAQKELQQTYQPQSFTPVVHSGGALHMVAGENLFLQAANIKSGGAMALTAGNEFVIDYVPYRAEIESDGYHEKLRHLTTQLHSGGRLDLFSKQHLLIKGAQLLATGDITLVSAGNTELKALKNRDHGWQHGKLIDKTYQQGVEIESCGALNILAGGHLLFQAAKLKAQRIMDIAAQGGYLYAQAMEETEHYEEKRKSCNRWTLCLTKNSEHRTYHAVKNRVTEFHAGNDISLLSYNDSIYEATKINTQRNATLTSTHGRVLFKAVQNQTLNQTISNSQDIFITRLDKGSYSAVWQLPTIQYGGELTVNAAQGIEADVNGQKGQTLKQVIASLGDSPESQWLKVLQDKPDVNWHKVENEYKSWDITQQQLHPVSAAVIAIATGAAASALAIPAGISAASAAGLSGTSAIVMQGAVSAGVRAIAAKAAVSLANNQGDISATLKELGGSQSVKSIIASMAIEGSLAGLDTTVLSNGDSVAHSAQHYNPTFPRFSDGEWQHTVQRVTAQSLITSGVDTALNGGSFKDKLAAALVSQTSRQLHAEGAHLIAKNGQVLGNPGKLLSHGAMAALSAEIADSDKVAAAAGAFAAELAAIGLGDNYYVDSSNRQQKILDTSRVIGGLAGALASGTAEGAYSGADAGVIAVENNYLTAKESQRLEKDLAACKATGGDCRSVIQEYIDISNKNSQALIEACTGGGVSCVTWEELITAYTNEAKDAHPLQIRFGERLKDPDAAALVNYLNGTDLKFLQENITQGDRTLVVIMDPSSWPVAVMGAKAIVTNSVTRGKEQLIAVGVSSAANAGIQYGITGEVKLSDVIGAGVIGSITTGKGYNPTVTWNAAGGYYTAEIKGDDPFISALLSKAGASGGYATGNIIKVPMNKKLNPISKQYEWVPTGVWTITKPAPQNSIPSIAGNIGDSVMSEVVQDKLKNMPRKEQ